MQVCFHNKIGINQLILVSLFGDIYMIRRLSRYFTFLHQFFIAIHFLDLDCIISILWSGIIMFCSIILLFITIQNTTWIRLNIRIMINILILSELWRIYFYRELKANFLLSPVNTQSILFLTISSFILYPVAICFSCYIDRWLNTSSFIVQHLTICQRFS